MMCMLFFFNDTATTEIYTLSLHDALPICVYYRDVRVASLRQWAEIPWMLRQIRPDLYQDRKSTRLNSSHGYISYAVFCLKKKTGSSPAYRPSSGGLASISGALTPILWCTS